MKAVIYLLLAFCMTVSSYSLQALDAEDRDAIQQIISQFTEGWNHSSGAELAEHYSEDAGFVNIFGMLFSGRQEIEARHARILDTIMKGSTFEVTDQQLREVQSGLVIANVWWKVTNIPTSNLPLLSTTMEGIFTHVLVKDPEGWSITFTQNTAKPQ